MTEERLSAPLFEMVERYRVSQGRNMWSDMLEMDLVYILYGWTE